MMDRLMDIVEDWQGALLFIVVAAFLIFVTVMLVGEGKKDVECLRLGYTEYRSGHCIKRTDGTDHVVSLDSLRKAAH